MSSLFSLEKRYCNISFSIDKNRAMWWLTDVRTENGHQNDWLSNNQKNDYIILQNSLRKKIRQFLLRRSHFYCYNSAALLDNFQMYEHKKINNKHSGKHWATAQVAHRQLRQWNTSHIEDHISARNVIVFMLFCYFASFNAFVFI